MRKQSGFTLIELMIVVAIVGILAAIAIPAYRDFQVRSKVSEVIASMGACKTTMGEFYESNASWLNRAGNPIDANICQDAGGAGDRSRYVASIVVGPGLMTATTQNTGALNEGTIEMLAANAAGGAVVPPADIYQWVCGGGGTTLEARYLPGSCQG